MIISITATVYKTLPISKILKVKYEEHSGCGYLK